MVLLCTLYYSLGIVRLIIILPGTVCTRLLLLLVNIILYLLYYYYQIIVLKNSTAFSVAQPIHYVRAADF